MGRSSENGTALSHGHFFVLVLPKPPGYRWRDSWRMVLLVGLRPMPLWSRVRDSGCPEDYREP